MHIMINCILMLLMFIYGSNEGQIYNFMYADIITQKTHSNKQLGRDKNTSLLYLLYLMNSIYIYNDIINLQM